MKNSKIVIVTLEPPDPFGNAAARWYYVLIKELQARQYRVRCFSAYSNANEALRAKQAFPTIALYPFPSRGFFLKRKWETLKRPYSYFISQELEQDLRRELSQGYDILHLEQLWTGYLGLGCRRCLLSVHHLKLLDLASEPVDSLRGFVSKHLAWYSERSISKKFSYIRATTDRLRLELGKINPRATVFTIPIALDPALYSLPNGDQAPRRPTYDVGLIASMSWDLGRRAAIRLITSIWPKIKFKIKEGKLLIAGWNARKVLAEFLGRPDVTILENLPDPKQFFREISILAYPLSVGSGMKVKVLEAMAFGVPVVTTTEGIEGLDVEQGVHAFIADDNEPFAELTAELLLDRDRQEKVKRCARSLVEEKYSPKPTIDAMEKIYEAIP